VRESLEVRDFIIFERQGLCFPVLIRALGSGVG
jgi:hypothetical protein